MVSLATHQERQEEEEETHEKDLLKKLERTEQRQNGGLTARNSLLARLQEEGHDPALHLPQAVQGR